MSNKIEIGYDERGYTRAMKLHSSFKLALKDIKAEAKNLGVTVTEDELMLSNNAFTMVADKLVASMDLNLPNISSTKYLAMTNLDLTRLSASSNRFEQSKDFKFKPNKEQFTSYVADHQMDRYLELVKYQDLLNEMNEAGLIKNLIGVQQATAGLFRVDTASMSYKLNLQ